MTFTEAALAVLEREGRPMHSREIAEKAVELGILSHVGKTPVQTMSARLSAAVSKGDPSGKAIFVRIRPGVFALAVWDGKVPNPKGEAGAKEAKEKPHPSSRKTSDGPSRTPRKGVEKSHQQNRAPSRESEPPLQKESNKQTDSQRISEIPGAEETLGPKKKKRRRRKKRSDETETSSENVTTPVATAQVNMNAPSTPGSQSVSPAAPPHPPAAPPHPPAASPHHPAASPHHPAAPPPAPPSAPSNQKPRPEPKKTNGNSLVDRIEHVLRRQNKPLHPGAIADQIGRGGENGVTLVEALIIADALEREARGLRPRFIEHRNGFVLAEREVSTEVLGLEQQIADSRERLVQIAEKQLLRKLRSLSMKTFVRVMAVHLQRSGFEALVPVARNRKDEFHLSVQDRRHAGRFRTAVVLRRDNADYRVSENLVFDLRGALHLYGASNGLIVTTGAFHEQAKEEARIPNLPPIALIDGDMLCKEMVRLGIGVRNRNVTLPAFDASFFSTVED